MDKINLCSWITDLIHCDRQEIYNIPQLYDTPPMFNAEHPTTLIIDSEMATGSMVPKANASIERDAKTDDSKPKPIRSSVFLETLAHETIAPAPSCLVATHLKPVSRKPKLKLYKTDTNIYETMEEIDEAAAIEPKTKEHPNPKRKK